MNACYGVLRDAAWGHMNGGAWSGWMPWGLLMMAAWIAIFTAVIWLVISELTDLRPFKRTTREPDVERARRILAERYAHGEIDTREYEERLARLL